jgi:hypothetical protein
MRRREFLDHLGAGCLAMGGTLRAGSMQAGPGQAPALTRPVLFNTPEADRIVSALTIFPPDNPWNVDISGWPVHPRSDRIIASIGADKPLRYNPDMNYVLVPADQKRVPVRLTGYPEESDPGPYPVPDNMPIEGWPAGDRAERFRRGTSLEEIQRDAHHRGGDRHAIVVDPTHGMVYEFYTARKTDDGWQVAQASIFDLKTNRLRPDGWTSTDAAGLPIFPAIVRYDELARGVVAHALRVTVERSRRAYVHPARHFASRDPSPDRPRMGERLRLRRDFDLSGFSRDVKTILTALKRHGMFVADNGLDWALSVSPDERIGNLHEELRRVKGSAFEVVEAPGRESEERP